MEIKHRRRPALPDGPDSGGWPRDQQGRLASARLQSKQRQSESPSAWARARPGSARRATLRKSALPTPSAHCGEWRGDAPCQTRSPQDSPSVRVRLPPAVLPLWPQYQPNPLSPGSPGSPARALHPGHRSRVRRARQAKCASGSRAGKAAEPRPGARGPGSRSGAAGTSAGGGRGRPERDRLGSARRARLEAGGARRGWRPQDQKSDSGSGQMSCCLSTARAAAQHSPL